MKLCACGCGKEVRLEKHSFVHGHNSIKHSDETKRKISKANRGRKHTEEARLKMSRALKGRIISEETRRKISEAGKGRKCSDETKAKMSEGQKGHEVSAATRKKLREAKLGRKNSPASKEKNRIASTGRKHTEEAIQKIRISHTGEKHYNWKGAKPAVYCHKFNDEIREQTRNKYDRKCFICGRNEEENYNHRKNLCKLLVHHVDMNKDQGCNEHEWKLVPLCLHCHISCHTDLMAARLSFILKEECSNKGCGYSRCA